MNIRSTIVLAAALFGIPSMAVAGDLGYEGQPPFGGLAVKFGVGYTALFLPETRVTTVTDTLALDFVSQVEDHDGEFDGAKYMLEVGGISLGNAFGHPTTMAVKGYFADMESSQQSQCDSDGPADRMCVFLPLFDPDPVAIDGEFAGTPFSEWRTNTDRDVQIWGVALEFGRDSVTYSGSLKDEAPVTVKSPFTFGVAVKAINQDTDLHSEDNSLVVDPVDLNEEMDTTYYGGFVGYNLSHQMGYGLSLALSGEVGVYYANTDYEARYHVSSPFGLGFGGVTELSETLSLENDDVSVIGSVKAELTKDMGWLKLGGFVEGEWYSYVPQVNYNNTDRAGGFDLLGTNDGTSIDGDTAWGYTVGGRVTVPLSK